MNFILFTVFLAITCSYSSGQDLITKQLPEILIKDSAAILTITHNKLNYISSQTQYRSLQTYVYEQIQVCNGQLKDSSVEQILSSKNRPTSAKDFNEISSRRFCNPKLQHLLQYSFLIKATIDQPKKLKRIAKNWNKYQKSVHPTQSSDITIILTKTKGDSISIILDPRTFNIKQINTYSRTRQNGYIKKLNSNQEIKAHHIVTTSFSYESNEVLIDSVTWIIQTEFYNKDTDRFYPHNLTAKLQLCQCGKLPKFPQQLKSIRSYIPCSAYLLN